MLEDALIDLSNRNEIILEPWWVGLDLRIACQNTGRVCRCIELDPLYVDVIVKRFETVTGQSARVEQTNEKFAELARRRRGKDTRGDCGV